MSIFKRFRAWLADRLMPEEAKPVPGAIKTWFPINAATPEEHAKARHVELEELFKDAVASWPGLRTAYHDSRKLKAVIEEEGRALLVQVWVEVTPTDLQQLVDQQNRRKEQAAQLRARADAIENPPESNVVTGRLNIKLSAEQLAQLRGGKG